MKTARFLLIINVCMIGLTLAGCRRSTSDVWEDTKTAKRYMGRGVRTLGGKHGDSRQINSQDEFAGDVRQGQPGDFSPISDQQAQEGLKVESSDYAQAKESPGDPGSSIPGIDAFDDPANSPELAAIFKNLHFDYNSSLLKGEENMRVIRQISAYLKRHPSTAIFVEGHCDERGPEAYNYALGARRANTVRNMLIDEGANQERLFTTSYGKDRPIIQGHDDISWRQNRRAQFKVNER